jgi:DNA-binding transcriptional LysR family regulator
MRLNQLQLLLNLASEGSLRAAAARMHLTQPALTKALRALEAEFGALLVQRLPKGVRLTAIGEQVAARAARVLREIERAREDVAWHLQDSLGSVTLGVSPVAGTLLMPGVVKRFQARWPGVQIHIVDTLYPRSLQLVRAGEVDIAIGPLPPEGIGHDVTAHALMLSQDVIAARSDHPLAGSRRLADLAGARWILMGPRGGPGDPRHLRLPARGMPEPEVTLTSESFPTLLALMGDADLVAVMPRRFVAQFGSRLNLAALPIEDTLTQTTIHALHRAETPLPAAVERMLDGLRQEAAELSGAAID